MFQQPHATLPVVLLHAALLALPATTAAQDSTLAPLSPSTLAGELAQRPGAAQLPDGLIRGGSPAYGVSFDDRGFELTPVRGATAFRATSLGFELETIERADWRRDFDVAQPTLCTPERVEYARGTDVVERYDLRSSGVEQSFVFFEPLGGSGELIVRGRLRGAAAFTGLREAASGELLFDAPEGGSLRYGAVTGIDAAGAQVAGHLRLSGDALELVLPGAFVDAATYPLTLDPLVGSPASTPAAPFGQTISDIAYNASTQTYLLAWIVQYSANQSDVRIQRLSAEGVPIDPAPIPVATALVGRDRIAVANVERWDRFVIAWGESSGARSLYAVGVDAAPAGGVSAPTFLGQGEGALAMGGEQDDFSDRVLVAWSSPSEGRLRGILLNVASGAAPIVELLLSLPEPDPLAGSIAMARHAGPNGAWFVTYDVDLPAGQAIRGFIVSRSGFLGGAPVELAAIPAQTPQPGTVGHRGFACAARGNNEFLLLYAASSGLHTVQASFNPALPVAVALSAEAPKLLIDATGNPRQPAVDFADAKYIVAWYEDDSQPGSTRVRATALAPSNCQVCDDLHELGSSTNLAEYPRICARFSGSQFAGDEALVTYAAQNSIYYQRLEAVGSGGSIATVLQSCGTGAGQSSVVGPAALGSPDFAFRLDDASVASPLAYLTLRFSLDAVFCSCPILVWQSNLLFAVPMTGTSAEFPVAVPCDPNLAGAQIYFQWAVFTGGQGPTCLSDYSFTNVRTIAIGN